MEQTIKLNRKLYNKKSRKRKGGTLRTQQFKRDIQTLDSYLRSLIQSAKRNPCIDHAGNDCKLIGSSSKSEQVIIICKGSNMVLKGPPTGILGGEAVFNLEFSDQDNACIKMNSSTMNLLIQSVIKDLFDNDEENFSDIEKYKNICSQSEGIFKKSPYFLVGEKYHYCPEPKDRCREEGSVSSLDSLDTELTSIRSERSDRSDSEEEEQAANIEDEEQAANIEDEEDIEGEGENEAEKVMKEDKQISEGGGLFGQLTNYLTNTSSGDSGREQKEEVLCPPSTEDDYIDNGKKGGYITLDGYLKELKDFSDKGRSKLPIIQDKIIKPIFQKLDNLFKNIQFHHVDPKAHQIFLEGECDNLRPILGDLDKVTFTLNIEGTHYRMRTKRSRDFIKSKGNTLAEKTGYLNKITEMRYECFPEKNNNIEKLGFLASICVLAPFEIANQIREFGLNLIYRDQPIDDPLTIEQLRIIINEPDKSEYPTLKKFDQDWRTNLPQSKIETKENSLGFSFGFVQINSEKNIKKNMNLQSIVSLNKKVDIEKGGIIIYDLHTESSKISIPTYSIPIESSEVSSDASSVVSSEASSELNEELRYVLWIRHCEACHNVASGVPPYREQPLCTEKGIAEAYTFGKNFYKINEIINKLIEKKLIKISANEKKYDLYCSVLARAMETCKIMSIGMNTFLDSSNQITRINGIQEVDKDFFSGPNIITKRVSDDSCLFLNKNIDKGLEIDCSRIINDNTKNPTDRFEIANSKDLQKKYLEFKNNLFSDKFTPENVKCIVSHSAYIKDIMKLPYRLNNLDAVLCVYKKQDDGFIIEKEKYLILLEDLINNSDNIYYDLNNAEDKKPIIKKDDLQSSGKEALGFTVKIRYGTKKIDKKSLKAGYDYANSLFETCEKFKNCGYTTNELYENSCEHDKKIQEAKTEREEELLKHGIDNQPLFGGKRGKKTRHKKIKKIKKLTKKFQKKKYKKTKKGRKKKFTKKKVNNLK